MRLIQIHIQKRKASFVHLNDNLQIFMHFQILISRLISHHFNFAHFIFGLFLAINHKFAVKSLGSNREIRCIISQWVMHFVIRNTKSIGYIRSRMRLWEHILDFLAGINIPFWHIMFTHNLLIFFPFWLFSTSNFSFTH